MLHIGLGFHAGETIEGSIIVAFNFCCKVLIPSFPLCGNAKRLKAFRSGFSLEFTFRWNEMFTE